MMVDEDGDVDDFKGGDDFLFPVYRLFKGLTYSKYYTLVR